MKPELTVIEYMTLPLVDLVKKPGFDPKHLRLIGEMLAYDQPKANVIGIHGAPDAS